MFGGNVPTTDSINVGTRNWAVVAFSDALIQPIV